LHFLKKHFIFSQKSFMKYLLKTCAAISCLLFSFTSFAQSQEDMQKWMAYMTPGEMHQMLAKASGEWTATITNWMSAGAEPSISTGTAVNKMIMDGRYQQSNYSASFGVMPFMGQNILGYDNIKKVFMSSWIDNMGTGVMLMQGTYDAATKTISLSGSSLNPITGQDQSMRETLQLIDDNTQLMQMFTTENGKEFKTMEIKFTRK
jgi:hypothetical protein